MSPRNSPSPTGRRPSVTHNDLFLKLRKNARRRTAISLRPSRYANRLASGLYLRFYNAHVADFNAVEDLVDVLPGHTKVLPLKASIVDGVDWTSQEKELFFKALSRRGRSNVELISKDIGSKSVLEVSLYLHRLKTTYDSMRQRCPANAPNPEVFGLLNYVNLPAAFEISETALSAEQSKASLLKKYVDKHTFTQESKALGWSTITRKVSEIIEEEVSTHDEEKQDMYYRAAPDLVTLNAKNLHRWTSLTSLAYSLDKDVTYREFRHLTTIARPSPEKVIYRTTVRALYDHLTHLTRQLVRCAASLSRSRQDVEKGNYFSRESGRFSGRGEVSLSDVLGACKVLGLDQRRDRDAASETYGEDEEKRRLKVREESFEASECLGVSSDEEMRQTRGIEDLDSSMIDAHSDEPSHSTIFDPEAAHAEKEEENEEDDEEENNEKDEEEEENHEEEEEDEGNHEEEEGEEGEEEEEKEQLRLEDLIDRHDLHRSATHESTFRQFLDLPHHTHPFFATEALTKEEWCGVVRYGMNQRQSDALDDGED